MALIAPLRASDQAEGRWPMICAKTGRPTAVSVAIQTVDRPTWTAVLLPVTVVGWLIARWFAANRTVAHVAISPETF